MKKAIGLVTYKPNEINLEFLNNFTQYDVYIIIDDNTTNYQHFEEKYRCLNIIQIDNTICYNTGFTNTSTVTLNKPVTGWDKALYFFSNIKKEYDYVWIFEDDVFFYNEETLKIIDTKYENTDILCNSSFEKSNLEGWNWHLISINFPEPYCIGMMCICRFSRKLLDSISSYAEKNNTLFFLEALFPSIAKYNELECYPLPSEFLTVTTCNIFTAKDFNKTDLYHPVKNLNNHTYLRKIL
jgi:hypothetical protein